MVDITVLLMLNDPNLWSYRQWSLTQELFSIIEIKNYESFLFSGEEIYFSCIFNAF